MVKLQKVNLKKSKIQNKKIKELEDQRKPLFSVTEDECDVIINRNIGGKWKGFLFTQLHEDWEGQKLLRWIIGADFDDKIKDIAANILGED